MDKSRKRLKTDKSTDWFSLLCIRVGIGVKELASIFFQERVPTELDSLFHEFVK